MNHTKHFALTVLLFAVGSLLIVTCKTKETEPASNKNSNTTPATDYLKIGSIHFNSPSHFNVSAGFVGNTRNTELKIYAGFRKSPKDTFLSVTHDTILIDFPCKSGMGRTLKDSTVRFYSRLSFQAGAPIMSTVFSNVKYGSYVIRMENGKRVSYFSGIVIEDKDAQKFYTCEGRITWP